MEAAQSRPKKVNTTMYMNRRHAQQDLRNVLNDYSDTLQNLKPGEVFRKTVQTQETRNGYNSYRGQEPTRVTWDHVSISVRKKPNGELEVIHYSPSVEGLKNK